MPDFLLTTGVTLGLIAVVAVFTMAVRAFIEPRLLEINCHMFRQENSTLPQITPPISGALNEEADLRVAFFSDLHGKNCKVPVNTLIDGIFKYPCDAVIFGGDIADFGKKPEAGLRILRTIADRAREQNIPCLAVRGNHDLFLPIDLIRQTGFRFLMNEWTKLQGSSGEHFLLIGVDEPPNKNLSAAKMPDHLPLDVAVNRRIVLVHNPDFIFSEKSTPFYRFQLSGHLHGGQIALPLVRKLREARGDRLPKEGFLWGPLYKNEIFTYVTRGVGCVLFPLRLFAKPQVVHLHFPKESRL